MSNIIEIKNLTKYYGGISALKDISLSIKSGSIHSICGENGAGKSTFIKILSGVEVKSSGDIKINGNFIQNLTPKISLRLGVNVVYQEFSLVEELTIAENIFLSDIKKYINNSFLKIQKMFKDADKLMNQLNINFDSKIKVSALSNSEKQLIEIVKALSKESKILILDEPTAVLSVAESEKLFEILLRLKKNGVTIIYISHRMKEIFRISDATSIFRDGNCVYSGDIKGLDEETVINYMLGVTEVKNREKIIKEKNRIVNKEFLEDKNAILMEAKNIYSNTGINNTNFFLNKREILGIYGIVGSGRTELSRLLFGIDNISSGELIFMGEKIFLKKPNDAISKKIALVPESRKDHGCILNMLVSENIVLPSQKEILKNLIFIDKNKESSIAERMISKLRIKARKYNFVKNLSGGNQQKVVLAKWMCKNVSLLILDEPTRGVDVGAKDEIYKLIFEFNKNGGTIILISSELDEIIKLSDRVYIMNRGKLSLPLEHEQIEENNILRYSVC